MVSRRILAMLAALCLISMLFAVSMKQAEANCTAPCTKAQIANDVNTFLADNHVGGITPAIVRSMFLETINSYLDINGTSSFTCPSHQFLNTIATLSSYGCAQPVIADLSGLGTGVATALGNALNASGGLVGFSGNIGVSTGSSLALGGASIGGNALAVTGSTVLGSLAASTSSITSGSATALVVGPNGITNPVLTVVDSIASQADGLNITGTASGSGVALQTSSPASNSLLTLNSKGTGGLFLQNSATGPISLGAASSIMSPSTNAFAVGANGITNPAFNVNASSASQVAGVNISGAGTGGTVAISTIDTGAANNLVINALGTGTIGIGTTSTGTVTVPKLAVTTINGNTFTPGTGTLTIAAAKTATHNASTTFAGVDGKTLTINNSLTMAGTDATTQTFPTTNATIARTDAAQTFTGTQTFAGAALSSSASAGIGYATGVGAGGAVTQITSRTTPVTLNAITGAITLVSAAPVLNAWATFTLTDSSIAATDVLAVSVKTATNTYVAAVSAMGAGGAQISIVSVSGTTPDSPVINFAIIKGSAN